VDGAADGKENSRVGQASSLSLKFLLSISGRSGFDRHPDRDFSRALKSVLFGTASPATS
jgi:hypothetical protein